MRILALLGLFILALAAPALAIAETICRSTIGFIASFARSTVTMPRQFAGPDGHPVSILESRRCSLA